MVTERHAREGICRTGVTEMTSEADERVRDERDRDRREEKREWDRSSDQAGRRDAVQSHRGGQRHDPKRKGNRLPEAKLPPRAFRAFGYLRRSARRYHQPPPSLKISFRRNIPSTQFGTSPTPWHCRRACPHAIIHA